jgi:hypothetical protein
MLPSERALVLVLGIALAAALPLRVRGADDLWPTADALPPPLAWRDPAPITRLFLQLPFEAPTVVPRHELKVDLDVLYSNTLMVARNDALVLDVHVEAAQPMLMVRYGLAAGVEAQLAVSGVVDYGGFLDGAIDDVEALFHASNTQRIGLPRGVARFQLTRAGGGGILRSGPGAGVGDVWTGLKVSLIDGDGGRGVAVRGALKLPTARLPYGSEEVDIGGSILAGWAWRATAVRFQLDVALPTESLPAVRLETHGYGAVSMGVAHRLGDGLVLHLQGSTHLSPLARTGIGQLDDATTYLLVGATLALSRSIDARVAVIENVFSPLRGADISFILGASSRW